MLFCGFSTKASIGLSYFLDLVLVLIIFLAETVFTVFITIFTLFIFLGFAYLGQRRTGQQCTFPDTRPWYEQSNNWLRYCVLFMGVVASFISLFDIMDDLVFRNIKESDGYRFATECLYFMPPVIVGLSWMLLGSLFILSSIFLALKIFPTHSPT